MIAYHILCHGNFPQVSRLIESLYSPEDQFLIDIDDGNSPDTQAIEPWLRKPNVAVTRDANIGWGGAGTLRKTIKGAFRLLDNSAGWEYYVVLSGQDLPLKSNHQIKETLSQGSANQLSFIRASRPAEADLSSIPIKNTSRQAVMWGDRGHTRVFGRAGTIDPQVEFGARRLVDVTEVADRGEVYVGLADPLLLKRRESFFEKYPFHVGANWFNLHRAFLEHLRADPFAYELYDVIRTTFIPDESYFQTYIKNSPFRERLSKDHGRLILRPGPVPRVKVFDIQDWQAISDSDALYGRKFDTRHDVKVVNKVLEARAA